MKDKLIKILFIGDIIGRPGRRAVEHFLPILKKEQVIDLVLANGENLSAGKGITLEKYEEIISFGVDYLTSGNHVWSNKEFVEAMDETRIKLLRPANYPQDCPGRGITQIKVRNVTLIIANLIGRVFMRDDVEDPFVVGKNIVKRYEKYPIIIDFHAEATSEKVALANYLDGEAAAVVGTHTHVQTADERILPSGTAFITDIGMCGPIDSVIGVKKEIIIEKFLTQLPKSHKVASGDSIFNAVLLTLNPRLKKVITIERISRVYKAS